MKSNGIEDVEDELVEDLAWRKREMINLSFAVEAESTDLQKSVLVRAGISLLCAHWEGYIRHAANAYIMLISSQKIKVKELKDNFLTLKMKKKISQVSVSKKTSVQQTLVQEIIGIMETDFTIQYIDKPGKRIINTDSNLNYELFQEILQVLDIDNIYETKRHYIDAMMLKNRNSIVHGEKVFFDKFDFVSLFNQVFEIMESFKGQLIQNADEEKYIKN